MPTRERPAELGLRVLSRSGVRRRLPRARIPDEHPTRPIARPSRRTTKLADTVGLPGARRGAILEVMADDQPRPSFTERAEQLQRDMQARQAARDAGTAPKRTAKDFIAGLWGLSLLLVLVLVVLGLVALGVWFVIASAGIILKLAGAILVVVIASLAWQQMTAKS